RPGGTGGAGPPDDLGVGPGRQARGTGVVRRADRPCRAGRCRMTGRAVLARGAALVACGAVLARVAALARGAALVACGLTVAACTTAAGEPAPGRARPPRPGGGGDPARGPRSQPRR